MTVAPLATLQTTTTTGTGTLTLITGGSNVRSFNGALGSSSIATPYFIRFATGYELGVGVYDGGTPGTLTRPSANVIASSNGGSLVTLPAGTADVYIPFLPGLRGVKTGTGSDVLGQTAAGERYVWIGTIASQTLTLPPVSTFPPGIGLLVQNRGTYPLTVDGNASETINGLLSVTLYPGQSVELFQRSSAWDAIGNYGVPPIYKTGSLTFTAGVASVTFATAFPTGIVSARAWKTGATAAGNYYGVATGTGIGLSGCDFYTDAAYAGTGTYEAFGY